VLVKISGRAHAETIVKLLGRIARARRNAISLRSIRIAAFASNPVIYGLSRMFQGLAEGAELVSVFNDRARAKAWLLES
jgi:hypothetical protein